METQKGKEEEESGTGGGPPPQTTVTPADDGMIDLGAVQAAVDEQNTFSRMVVCTATRVLAASYPVGGEGGAVASHLAGAFADRTETVKNGIMLENVLFDVHRFYDNLIYGRRGHDEHTSGFGIVQFPREAFSDYVYIAVSFEQPMTTARAMPLLHRFAMQRILPLVVGSA